MYNVLLSREIIWRLNQILLNFNSPKIPDSLKICYLIIPVTQYLPNPVLCYKCQRFGYFTSKYKHNKTSSVRLTISGNYHSCGGCEENCRSGQMIDCEKGEKSSKPSSPEQQSAPVPDAYFTIKSINEKVKDNSPIANVKVSPITNVKI